MTTCSMCTKWRDEPDLQIAELERCYLLLNRDQFFPGYCLIVTKEHVTELFHLDRQTRSAVMEEVSAAATALYNLFKPAKMNYELLGNMVPHMHWHLVPRFTTDPLWPRPIWSEQHNETILHPRDYVKRVELIRTALVTPQISRTI